MRVVFLTHNYPRWAGDVAGAFLATLARGVAARGIEVRVIAPSDDGKGGDTELDGILVRRVRYARPSLERIAYRGTMQAALRRPGGWRALLGLWRALRSAARAELALGADLVHAHWWIPAGLAAPPEAPMVLTVHGTDARLLRKSKVARALARPVFERARIVTTVSTDLGTTVQNSLSLHLPPGRVQPMPIDTSAFHWSKGGGGAVVVSRLTPQKRVHLAIEAAACLNALDRPMPLTIIGEGPERERLARLAAALGVGALVFFTGAVEHSRIAGYLQQADLMFFPAQAEGFGLVAAEALMSGVPVVACWDGGGVLDVVPESGAGRLVLPSAEALADAALDILQDTRRQAAALKAGAEWRRRLDPAVVAEACEGWYREALGG